MDRNYSVVYGKVEFNVYPGQHRRLETWRIYPDSVPWSLQSHIEGRHADASLFQFELWKVVLTIPMMLFYTLLYRPVLFSDYRLLPTQDFRSFIPKVL